MNKIKVAVVGIGYLGEFHAEKYKNNKNADLIALVDTDRQRREEVSAKLGIKSYGNIKDVVDKVDAVSIVVPTDMHYEVADYFIKNNKHILIEKPFASNVAEAEKLEEKARDKDIILQIGHLERFNKAFSKLKDKVNNPLFIECNRISPFKIRGTEVNVVMDLMIHDLDIVMSLNKSNIKSIKASGASVLTDTTDIANARVEFENGCVCNLSASRISDKIERKMRVFQKNSYFSLDYQACKLDSYKKIVVEENKKIEKTRDTFLENDPLNEEVKSFINCIKENKKPLVDAVDGIKALKYAITISNLIKK
jgi:predicted dehydrogenase